MKLYVVEYHYLDPDGNTKSSFDCVFLNKENADKFVEQNNTPILEEYLKSQKLFCERYNFEFDKDECIESFYSDYLGEYYAVTEVETKD